ncbi:MAG: NUDIX hydrolase [Gammaproteobacteria bacterium]|nr:NUDIX hydrolase [Gammaproteobacteria bacterium]
MTDHQWKPNVTVAAIVERDGHFLLVEEEADGAVLVNQPAGHLEYGETLLDAVRREVREETGHEFEPQALVGVYLYPNPRVDIVYLRFSFAGSARAPAGDAVLDDGIIRTLWLNREETGALGERLRSDMVTRCIDDYLAGRRYSLEMLHHINMDNLTA